MASDAKPAILSQREAQLASALLTLTLKPPKDAADASQKLATREGYQAVAMFVDVTDRNSVRAVVADTHELFGRIDYNINSAGVCRLDKQARSKSCGSDTLIVK